MSSLGKGRGPGAQLVTSGGRDSSGLEGPDKRHNELRERWWQNVADPCRSAGRETPLLFILQAQYRAIHASILRLSQELQTKYPGRVVAVLISELIKQRWRQYLLHTWRARRVRRQLLEHGGSLLTVIDMPWYLHEERRGNIIRVAHLM